MNGRVGGQSPQIDDEVGGEVVFLHSIDGGGRGGVGNVRVGLVGIWVSGSRVNSILIAATIEKDHVVLVKVGLAVPQIVGGV